MCSDLCDYCNRSAGLLSKNVKELEYHEAPIRKILDSLGELYALDGSTTDEKYNAAVLDRGLQLKRELSVLLVNK